MCHIFIYPQEERVKVVDVSVMNKICNGKFYNDNRKLISVSYIQFTTYLQFNNVLIWQLNIQQYDYAIGKTFTITYIDPKGERNIVMYQLAKHWR